MVSLAAFAAFRAFAAKRFFSIIFRPSEPCFFQKFFERFTRHHLDGGTRFGIAQTSLSLAFKLRLGKFYGNN